VTNEDGTISTLDPVTGAVEGAPIAVGEDVDDVSVGADSVWAVALYGKTLARIDPMSRVVVGRTSTAGEPSGVLASGNSVWLSSYDKGTVARFNPSRSRVVRTYRVGRLPRGLAEAAGSIWVANQGSDSVSRITPSHRGRGASRRPVPSRRRSASTSSE
jgi:streptogramin lyase